MKKRILLSLSLMALANVALASGKVVVIVNDANNKRLSQEEVKAIYSDNIITWDNGSTIKSYDLPVKNDAREAFSQAVMGMSATEVAMEWANRKITNTAKNPPKTKKENLVVLSVSRDPDAIGYVPEDAVKGKQGVKVILTLD